MKFAGTLLGVMLLASGSFAQEWSSRVCEAFPELLLCKNKPTEYRPITIARQTLEGADYLRNRLTAATHAIVTTPAEETSSKKLILRMIPFPAKMALLGGDMITAWSLGLHLEHAFQVIRGTQPDPPPVAPGLAPLIGRINNN